MVVSTEKLAWPKDRPLPGIERPLPAGTTVVSTDSHWLEPESFVDHMPAKFRDRAPVGKFNEDGYHFEIDGENQDNPAIPSAM